MGKESPPACSPPPPAFRQLQRKDAQLSFLPCQELGRRGRKPSPRRHTDPAWPFLCDPSPQCKVPHSMGAAFPPDPVPSIVKSWARFPALGVPGCSSRRMGQRGKGAKPAPPPQQTVEGASQQEGSLSPHTPKPPNNGSQKLQHRAPQPSFLLCQEQGLGGEEGNGDSLLCGPAQAPPRPEPTSLGRGRG